MKNENYEKKKRKITKITKTQKILYINIRRLKNNKVHDI